MVKDCKLYWSGKDFAHFDIFAGHIHFLPVIA